MHDFAYQHLTTWPPNLLNVDCLCSKISLSNAVSSAWHTTVCQLIYLNTTGYRKQPGTNSQNLSIKGVEQGLKTVAQLIQSVKSHRYAHDHMVGRLIYHEFDSWIFNWKATGDQPTSRIPISDSEIGLSLTSQSTALLHFFKVKIQNYFITVKFTVYSFPTKHPCRLIQSNKLALAKNIEIPFTGNIPT